MGLSSERVGHGLSSAALELEYDWTENGAAKKVRRCNRALRWFWSEQNTCWDCGLGMLRWAGARVLHGVDGSSDG
ncbi:hypothetical protein M0R45_022360 [Rubus argutus]|uniref:Uncharacterized protein n=1 Tax=Rubus argutus TaxID=59490 RepID=A0AAW1XHK7_RUBAR